MAPRAPHDSRMVWVATATSRKSIDREARAFAGGAAHAVDRHRQSAQSFRSGTSTFILNMGARHETSPAASSNRFRSRDPEPRSSGRYRFPNRSAGESFLPDELQSQSAGPVRARRGDVAFLLV